ncbi:PREDICTED: CMRF35-like molecule 1 isoform X4 [Colobus angolensis palliatus]|uniref:Immunoglobulin V-set domain-containing protein n=1 Tax=Colobus angolensis palliatus TaxID=336983 RepID=A0A2K5H8N4_COLAP|nr:PREDICTED: CMRF35-like molecule 1 isoform X4 [Colobus angolensis palliatus]
MPLLMLYPLLFWLSGYSIATDISGPMTVNGLERGSLIVQCVYKSGWETYLKWWCRGAIWHGCKILVKTTGSEQEVKRDRVSIKDNQKNHTFTVTMEGLMQTDADTYWCGIERTGTDLGVTVQVTVDPAPVTPEETSNSPTLTGHHLDKRSEGSRAANHRPPVHQAQPPEAQRPPAPHLHHIAAAFGGCFTLGLEDNEVPAESGWDVPRAGTAAPGGRPLLCRPDPAADQNLPTKGYHEALLLWPG